MSSPTNERAAYQPPNIKSYEMRKVHLVTVTARESCEFEPHLDPELCIWIKEMAWFYLPQIGASVGVPLFGQLNLFEVVDILFVDGDPVPLVLLDVDLRDESEDPRETAQRMKDSRWEAMINQGPVAEHIIEFCIESRLD